MTIGDIDRNMSFDESRSHPGPGERRTDAQHDADPDHERDGWEGPPLPAPLPADRHEWGP